MALLGMQASSPEESRAVLTTKQAYRRPELLQYGTLREITLMLASGEAHDNVTNCSSGFCHTN